MITTTGPIMCAALAALTLAACGPVPPAAVAPTASPSVSSAPTAPEGPVTVKGGGISNSRPFYLRGGDYHITWTATPGSDSGCVYGGDLRSTVKSLPDEIFAHVVLRDQNPESGESFAYRLPSGTYYAAINSSCESWSVTVQHNPA